FIAPVFLIPHLVFLSLGLSAIVFLYFRMAKSVARGGRLAIAFCLFLVSLIFGVATIRLFQDQGKDIGEMIFHTIIMIALLNLIKLLIQSGGAARRLTMWRNPAIVYPADES